MTVENIQCKVVTLDTNIMLRMVESPNFANMLDMHVQLDGANVHIPDTVSKEIARKNLDIKDVRRELESRGAVVILGDTTAGMRIDARIMEGKHPKLHYPDSRILAYAKSYKTCFVTRDRDLAEAAELEGVDVVNPDTICSPDGRFRSRYGNDIDDYRRSGPGGHLARPGFGPGSAPSTLPKRRRRNLKRRAAPFLRHA